MVIPDPGATLHLQRPPWQPEQTPNAQELQVLLYQSLALAHAVTEASAAARCSGRLSTASYSNSSGVVTTIRGSLALHATSVRAAKPRGLRNAATKTEVSRTTFTDTLAVV